MTESKPKKSLISRRNLATLWLPLCVALGMLIFSALVPRRWGYEWLASTLSLAFVACLGYFVLLLLLRLVQRKWAAAFAAFSCLVVSLLAVVPVVVLAFANAIFAPSEDGFADDLEIPEGISITAPKPWPPASANADDPFQDAILASLNRPGDGEAEFSVSLDNLSQVHRNSPAILERYLATHPGWRVFREHGKRFATRRWAIESAWRYSLHGYYSDFDVRDWRGPDAPAFQSRVTIGLDGQPWARNLQDSTTASLGDTVVPVLTTGNAKPESHVVISTNGLVVELFEQSSTKERRVTKAALEFVDNEFQALRGIRDWQALRTTLDEAFVHQGAPTFELYESFQPGIYESYIWANPGEAGMIYLKAFEITRDHRLSATRLLERSNEWMGWSNDPNELFFSNTHFMIYEGDWGKPYAARFELWFVPDSGDPERKLFEKNFKIEGWMR